MVATRQKSRAKIQNMKQQQQTEFGNKTIENRQTKLADRNMKETVEINSDQKIKDKMTVVSP